MSVFCGRPGHAANYLVRAAVTAPSLHHTQSWTFVEESGDRGIEVHADATRRLLLTDPYGREMVIGCGAALFNIRLAMRHLGFNPVVEPFPHTGDPAFLARASWGAYGRPTHDEERMYGALSRRHTVRGPFRPDPLPTSLIDALREHASDEGATLHYIDADDERQRLAELVRAAEDVHGTDPGHVAEQVRWTWRGARPGGVLADAVVTHPDRTTYAGRDYTDLTGTFPLPHRQRPSRTGLVAVLCTDRDDRVDWLRAGQALERILLYAAAHGVMAAFHTQPLELPRSRARIRESFTAGAFPQMILRLGYASSVRPLPRRPVADVYLANDDRADGVAH
ncbi:hypothetical protein OG762_01035 [Streptomyces sp. NBC_01136]|uniref:Acg family FMN-binding oxidoreductase n=1 Tax=unclassified Streptomyces TaxID=2593676 RepID=UPI00324E6AE7|nr:hypothetical protein OG762_01035 [Streptomyces sp. NBC_01136]